jgi:hypothetical protein
MTDHELELIEKWKLLSALTGVNINDLYDSDDDNAEEVFSCLEKIEEYEQLSTDYELPFKVAMQGRKLGLTTEKLWEYHSYQNELLAKAERERLEEDERNNSRIKNLREKHKLTFTKGKSKDQTYWTFEADLGDGVRVYNCRHVRVSWFTQRIWREWKDSSGKKQRDKMEFGGSTSFYMDNHWPEKWKQNYNRNFSSSQIPYAYTNEVISKARVNKTSKKKKEKAV